MFKYKNLIPVIIIAMFLAFPGCKKNTTTGNGDTNTAATILCWLYNSGSQLILISDPIADPAQSEAKIKWGSNSRTFPSEGIGPDYVVFEDTTTLVPLTNYTIELTSNLGNSSGTIALPESTLITAPLDDDTLSLGQPVTCTWTSAQGAQYYDVYYDASAYNDSGYIGECSMREVYPTSNSITIPVSYFNVLGAAYYYVFLHVATCSGPIPQAGQTGNMSGTIKGFLVGNGSGQYINFYVGTPVKGTAVGGTSQSRLSDTRKDRMNSYLHHLGLSAVIQ